MMGIIEKFKFIKPGEVRTRFAPSPTGFLHIGSARTALFNYLFAKKNKGSFILRIEDTDKERSKPEFEQDIIENLKWIGIESDEDIIRQSERGDIYTKYLKKLLEQDMAYYCFCSEEELEDQRQEQMSRGLPARYNEKCLQLSSEQVKKNLAEEKKSIIRFKMPAQKIAFNDLVRGKVEFDSGLIGHVIIAKDLTSPLYNFAVVVDDFEMKISHIIRGEDLLPNTVIQILLQKALGFSQLEYAHLPLILGPDKSKLSKRHEAVSMAEYRKQGYLSETTINFLAFLGWNPGTEREIFSFASLVKEFSIERVQKGGAVFNIKRLDFLNGFYIRQKSLDKLTELCLPYLVQDGLLEPVFKTEQYPPAYGGMSITQDYMVNETEEKVNFNYLKKVVAIYQERLKKLSEIIELTDFFFKDKLDYDRGLLVWKNMTEKEVGASLDKTIDVLSKIDKWDKNNIEKCLVSEEDRGKTLWPLRVALTGKQASAGPFEIAEILGKEKTLERIKQAGELLK